MPVRLLSSSVLKWPDEKTVDAAVRRWAKRVVLNKRNVFRIGYFGSYARGDWGVGSDLDLIVIMENCEELFIKRSAGWDVTEIPVPTDILIYAKEEWQDLSKGRFHKTVTQEAVWVYVLDTPTDTEIDRLGHSEI